MNAPDGRPTNAAFRRDSRLVLAPRRDPAGLSCSAPSICRVRPFATRFTRIQATSAAAPPVDLHPQVPLIQEVLEAMNLPMLSMAGLRGRRRDGDCLQGSGETRDSTSSSAPATRIAGNSSTTASACTTCANAKAFDRDSLQKVWGISPEQVVDFQTLVGDSVDNVPGVRGHRRKDRGQTACSNTERSTTSSPTWTKSSRRNSRRILKSAIAAGDLEKSRTLVRLDVNVPIDIDWDGWRLGEWDGPTLAGADARIRLPPLRRSGACDAQERKAPRRMRPFWRRSANAEPVAEEGQIRMEATIFSRASRTKPISPSARTSRPTTGTRLTRSLIRREVWAEFLAKLTAAKALRLRSGNDGPRSAAVRNRRLGVFMEVRRRILRSRLKARRERQAISIRERSSMR